MRSRITLLIGLSTVFLFFSVYGTPYVNGQSSTINGSPLDNETGSTNSVDPFVLRGSSDTGNTGNNNDPAQADDGSSTNSNNDDDGSSTNSNNDDTSIANDGSSTNSNNDESDKDGSSTNSNNDESDKDGSSTNSNNDESDKDGSDDDNSSKEDEESKDDRKFELPFP